MENKNLEKHLDWIMKNPKTVDIICREYCSGNSIKTIVENHNGEFDRHKVYAALDYSEIPRRRHPLNPTERFNQVVKKAIMLNR